jgi:hypothetical protein
MRELKNPLAVAQQATSDYQTCYGSDLIAMFMYGSAAGAGFDPRRSDINLLIVLREMSPALVAKSRAVQRAWSKKRCAPPLFMDRSYIERSLDSFPIEFLDFKERHTLLYGKDFLEDLPIAKADLRLQVERELKGKWLHLMREWASAHDDPRRLDQLMRLSLKDFSVSFRALLFLKEVPVPAERKELYAAVASAYGLAADSFEAAIDAHQANDRARMHTAFEPYALAIRSLTIAVDELII